jgi:putative hemolysin
MNISIWVLISAVPPLLLIEGFFSGSEIALLAADKLNLRAQAQRGSVRAKLALNLAEHPERILSTTLLMTSLCVIGISTLIAIFLISRSVAHGDLVTVAITSPLVVLLGELIPKTIYQRYADRIAPWVAYPVLWAYWIFYPITRLLSSYTRRLSMIVGPIEEMITGKRRTTREELVALLSYNQRESEIKTSEKRMIKRIFDFKDTEAKHALIPLVKVEAIEDIVSVREALEKFKNHRHSRMPVYSDRIDNIVGVIEASDLFAVNDLDVSIKGFISPARYVAETQALDDLMLEMRREDTEMVVIVDEYGGAIGILTFEDIIEEIVGEISDEYDQEQAPYKEISADSWLIQSRMEIQQINERLGLEIPEGDYETIGGFLLQQFGRIPETGDELYFNIPHASLKLTVRKANPRAIEVILIEREVKDPESET